MELVLDRKLAERRIYPAIDGSQERHAEGGKHSRLSIWMRSTNFAVR